MATINVLDPPGSVYPLFNNGDPNEENRLNGVFAIAVDGDEFFFPNGTYLMPVDYEYDFEDVSIRFRGESREGVIFTTYNGESGISMKCPPRVDITKPRPVEDGIYQIDTIGKSGIIDSAYSGLTDPQVGDYIELTGGSPDAVARTLEEVKTANMITYVDASTTTGLPTYEGYYVVNKISDVPSGGYPYSDFNPNPNETLLKVIIGSILKYDGTTNPWSVYVPSVAFSSTGDIYMENISFIDFTPFIYNPYGISPDRDLKINDCDFKFCTRVSAFEITGGNPSSTWIPHAMSTGTGIKSVPTQLYGFKSMQYLNNTFKYIHQSIVWGMPSAHDILIKDNICSENFSTLAYFVLIGGSIQGTAVRRSFKYEILNNTFTSCRLDSVSDEADESILFQLYDDAKFLNNTFLDTYGIHCYMSGDNSVIEGNVIKPYTNYDMYAGRNIFLYKNQGQDPQAQHILANNIIEGCSVTAIVTHQIGKILAEGNKFRMSRSSNYVFSDTLSISRSLFYYVKDLTQFTALAGGSNYVDSSVVSDVRAYWEARETRWKAIPTSGFDIIRPVFNIGTSNTEPEISEALYDTGFEIQNNSIHAEQVLSVTRRTNMCEISGNTLTGVRSMINVGVYQNEAMETHYYLENLILKNNPLVELILGGTIEAEFIVDRDIIIGNNTILTTYLSNLTLTSYLGNIDINNNYFGYKPDFPMPSYPTTQPSEPSVLEPSAYNQLDIRNNEINALDNMTHSVIRIRQSETAIIENNFAKIFCPDSPPAANYRTFVRNASATRLKILNLNNNNVIFADETETRIILGSDIGSMAYHGDILIINNNNASGVDDMLLDEIILFDSSSSSNIVFDEIRNKNNSWIEDVQYVSGNINSNPYQFENTIIFDDTSTISSATVTLPSDFLQDGQEILVSAPNIEVSSLSFSGGSIVPSSPSSFTLQPGDFLKLKYVKSEDIWYIVQKFITP